MCQEKSQNAEGIFSGAASMGNCVKYAATVESAIISSGGKMELKGSYFQDEMAVPRYLILLDTHSESGQNKRKDFVLFAQPRLSRPLNSRLI